MTRTLLLEVDVAVLVDLVDPVLEYASYKTGGDYEGTAVPDAARRLTVADPAERDRDVFVREAVLDALRHAHRSGVDIVWHSRWLATPSHLDALTRELGLEETVRRPSDAELAGPPTLPEDRPSPDIRDDWRFRTLVERVRRLGPDDDLVAADVALDLSARRVADAIIRRTGVAEPRIGSIPVYREWGLDDAALRSWTPDRPRTPEWHRRA